MTDRCVWFGSGNILNTFELVAKIFKLGNFTQNPDFQLLWRTQRSCKETGPHGCKERL